MITQRGYELIEAKEALKNLEVLREKVIYPDSFFNITREEQKEIYEYCLLNCNYKAVRDYLVQIRYVVAEQYFRE